MQASSIQHRGRVLAEALQGVRSDRADARRRPVAAGRLPRLLHPDGAGAERVSPMRRKLMGVQPPPPTQMTPRSRAISIGCRYLNRRRLRKS